MKESREIFRKIGLTFEEKAFYDILLALRDQYDFEYGTDKEVDGAVINDKCKALAQKVKEIIDTKSSFADWLNNQNVRNQLKLEIKMRLSLQPTRTGNTFIITLSTTPLRWTASGNSGIFYCPGWLCNG